MKIKLSRRDVEAATTDITNNNSQDPNTGNPIEKQNIELLKMKPQIDVNIKIDEERAAINQNLSMPLNSRNQLMRSQNIQKVQR